MIAGKFTWMSIEKTIKSKRDEAAFKYRISLPFTMESTDKSEEEWGGF